MESLDARHSSRLQPGDVIPFHDGRMSGGGERNGRDLYVCEFGRSGSHIRSAVKDTHGLEQDILRHIMS